MRHPINPHEHHRGFVFVSEQTYNVWTAWRHGPGGVRLPELWPGKVGETIVCDNCGKGWVVEQWPRVTPGRREVLRGQQREGCYLRREKWRERRRRLKLAAR